MGSWSLIAILLLESQFTLHADESLATFAPGATLVRFQRVLHKAAKRRPADYWVWDTVHPTYGDHQLLADERERVVREVWK